MKVKRIICPGCQVEEKTFSDEGNMREYSEQIVSKPCDKCKDIPEVRLLEAIFGKKEVNDEVR